MAKSNNGEDRGSSLKILDKLNNDKVGYFSFAFCDVVISKNLAKNAALDIWLLSVKIGISRLYLPRQKIIDISHKTIS